MISCLSPKTSRVILLIATLLIAAVCRLYNLGEPPITEDEAYHAVTALAWAETGAPIPPSGIPYTRGLPLVWLEMLSYRFSGLEMEAALRLPVALLGVLNTFIFYLLGKSYGGARAGLLVSLVFALSPWAQYFGTQLRMYELLLFASLVSLIAYDRFLMSATLLRAVTLCATLLFALTTHQLGVFLVLLPLVGAVLYCTSNFRRALTLVLLVIPVLVFWQIYPSLLDYIWPSPTTKAGGIDVIDAFVGAPLRPLSRALELVPWIWGALTLLTSVFVIRSLQTSPVSRGMALLPWWVVGIVATGLAGMTLVSATILSGFLVYSGGDARRPACVLACRLAAVKYFLLAFGTWILILIAISLQQKGAPVSAFLSNFGSLLRYPDYYYGLVRPLLLEPQVATQFLVGVGIAVFFVLRGVIKGPLITGNYSLASRLLFLVLAAFVMGSFQLNYRDDRYLYFMLPAALLSLAEFLSIYLRTKLNSAFTKVAVGAIVMLTLLVQSVLTFKQIPSNYTMPVPSLEQASHKSAEGEYRTFRSRPQVDYKALGHFLQHSMMEGDLIFADAAHQLQVYVPKIDAHLSPPINEYKAGRLHYFTGSVLLRSPAELENYVRRIQTQNRTLWFVVTGYDSVWSEVIPNALDNHLIYSGRYSRVYRVTMVDFVSIIREWPY